MTVNRGKRQKWRPDTGGMASTRPAHGIGASFTCMGDMPKRSKRSLAGLQISCTFARMRGYSLNRVQEQTLRGAQYLQELLHINYPVQFLRSRLLAVKSHILAFQARRKLATALRNRNVIQMTRLCEIPQVGGSTGAENMRTGS